MRLRIPIDGTKVTTGITVSIPREEAEELIEALKLGSSSLLSYGLLGNEARTLRAFAEGIRAAIESAGKKDST